MKSHFLWPVGLLQVDNCTCMFSKKLNIHTNTLGLRMKKKSTRESLYNNKLTEKIKLFIRNKVDRPPANHLYRRVESLFCFFVFITAQKRFTFAPISLA